MRRFLVFYGYVCYAGGGWRDFQDSFTNLADAREQADKLLTGGDWAHIVDTVTGIVVWASERQAHC
jgi:hypothetical protein